MDFDDLKQPMVWRDRNLCEHMTQPQIIETLTREAAAEGYEPCDLNYAGKPNIYLRAQFMLDRAGFKVWQKDGFVMFVRKMTVVLPGNAFNA